MTKEPSWEDFKPGIILWLKIIIIIGIFLGGSYLLSKLYLPFGFLFLIYISIFLAPTFVTAPLEGSILTMIFDFFVILLFPVYLLVALNYFYLYFKKKKTIWWLTTLFIVLSVLYTLGIIIGWFVFLVWHP